MDRCDKGEYPNGLNATIKANIQMDYFCVGLDTKGFSAGLSHRVWHAQGPNEDSLCTEIPSLIYRMMVRHV